MAVSIQSKLRRDRVKEDKVLGKRPSPETGTLDTMWLKKHQTWLVYTAGGWAGPSNRWVGTEHLLLNHPYPTHEQLGSGPMGHSAHEVFWVGKVSDKRGTEQGIICCQDTGTATEL